MTEDYVFLLDLTPEQLIDILSSLSITNLVAPFQKHQVDGNLLNECVEYQDLVDLDKEVVIPIVARRFFRELSQWKSNNGKVPMKLLLSPQASSSSFKSPHAVENEKHDIIIS